jgi:SpoVK/Ycf46/Vps4 family AAA+-type ATPase
VLRSVEASHAPPPKETHTHTHTHTHHKLLPLDSRFVADREVQRTLMELLSQLDGFESLGQVKIVMATNRPDVLDPALLRYGFTRFFATLAPNIP